MIHQAVVRDVLVFLGFIIKCTQILIYCWGYGLAIYMSIMDYNFYLVAYLPECGCQYRFKYVGVVGERKMTVCRWAWRV